MPLPIRGIERQGFAADRLHGDDTTVPVLAKGKTDTGQCWVYVRDDRPFGGAAPPGGNVLLLARSSRRAPDVHTSRSWLLVSAREACRRAGEREVHRGL